MKRNSRHQAAIGGLLLFLVATGSSQASQLHLTPLYLAKSDCERRLDRCLQGCRAGGAGKRDVRQSLLQGTRVMRGAAVGLVPVFVTLQYQNSHFCLLSRGRVSLNRVAFGL